MPVNGGLMREREGRAGSGEAREEGSTKGKGENKQKEVGEKGIMIRRVVVEHARVGVAPYSSYRSRQGFLSTTNCRW